MPTFVQEARTREEYRHYFADEPLEQQRLAPAPPLPIGVVTLDSKERAEEVLKLYSANQELKAQVHGLVISATNHAGRKDKTRDLQGWIAEYLPALANWLKNIVFLKFEDVQWNTLVNGIPPQLQTTLAQFKRVQDLEISGCGFKAFADFEIFVHSFGSLDRLTLRSMSWIENRTAIQTCDLSLRELRVISGCSLGLVAGWLGRLHVGSPYSPLRSIECHDIPDVELVGLSRILGAMGPNLQSLKLGVLVKVVGGADQVARYRQMAQWLMPLRNCTGLRDLVIRVSTTEPQLMAWAQILLDIVDARSLRTVTFEVWLAEACQLTGPIWKTVGEYISANPKFVLLQHVRFVNRGSLDVVKFRSAVWQQFPNLQGKLEVEDQSQPALFA